MQGDLFLKPATGAKSKIFRTNQRSLSMVDSASADMRIFHLATWGLGFVRVNFYPESEPKVAAQSSPGTCSTATTYNAAPQFTPLIGTQKANPTTRAPHPPMSPCTKALSKPQPVSLGWLRDVSLKTCLSRTPFLARNSALPRATCNPTSLKPCRQAATMPTSTSNTWPPAASASTNPSSRAPRRASRWASACASSRANAPATPIATTSARKRSATPPRWRPASPTGRPRWKSGSSGRREAQPLSRPHRAHRDRLAERVELVKRADAAARAYDPRVFQVQASYADNLRHVMVATSDGVLSFDRQPLARLSVSALARAKATASRSAAFAGGGGRVGMEFFQNGHSPEHFAREAARQAIVQLHAARRAGRRNDRRAGSRLAGHPAA